MAAPEGDRQRELCETVAERKALEGKLARLRDEVRACEESLGKLLQREQQLALPEHAATREQQALPEDAGLAPPARPAGPVFFQFEEEAGRAGGPDVIEVDDDWFDDSLQEPAYAEDWDSALESYGVARCCHCGLRCPPDRESIEKHLLECTGKNSGQGKCARCNMVLPLNVDDVEKHLALCAGSGVGGDGISGSSPQRKRMFRFWHDPLPEARQLNHLSDFIADTNF